MCSRRREEYTVNALTMFVSTRRTFLKAAAAGLAAPFAFAQASGQASKIDAQLGDNLYLLSGAGGNVIARTGADGVVMVDGGLAQNAGALAQAVAALPNSGPVRTLFNTHWHPEQTGSNEKLGTAGATIIAQENTRLWLQQNITWPWNGQKFKKLRQDRPAQQDLLRQGRARFRNPLRIHLRCGAHGRRSVRLLPAAERACGGRRRLRTRLAGGRLVDRRLDRRHCRRTAAHPDAWRTAIRRSFPRAVPCSAWPTSPRRSTCTARSTIV